MNRIAPGPFASIGTVNGAPVAPYPMELRARRGTEKDDAASATEHLLQMLAAFPAQSSVLTAFVGARGPIDGRLGESVVAAAAVGVGAGMRDR